MSAARKSAWERAPERLDGAPFRRALRKLAASNGSSTGTGLRPMPENISDVTAFNCTSAGVERGSEGQARRWPENVNVDATDGWVLISDRSASSTARHSTRTEEIAGVLNSSAARRALPAISASSETNRRAPNGNS